MLWLISVFTQLTMKQNFLLGNNVWFKNRIATVLSVLRNYDILKSVSFLREVFPDALTITFRRAPALTDILEKSSPHIQHKNWLGVPLMWITDLSVHMVVKGEQNTTEGLAEHKHATV